MGDNEYYDPNSSLIPNLFDISSDNGTEHFLLPSLLTILNDIGPRDEGYLATSEIYAVLQSSGYIPIQIENCISYALRFRLVEAFPRLVEEIDVRDIVRLRLTTAGAYSLTRLSSLFTYVDIILVDTPIVDSAFRDQIHNVHSIGDRLVRAKNFAKYIDSQYEKMVSSGLLVTFDWTLVRATLAADFEAIEHRLRMQLNSMLIARSDSQMEMSYLFKFKVLTRWHQEFDVSPCT
jgi:hypothetical protein